MTQKQLLDTFSPLTVSGSLRLLIDEKIMFHSPHFSHQHLARCIGVNRRSISRILNCPSPSVSSLMVVASGIYLRLLCSPHPHHREEAKFFLRCVSEWMVQGIVHPDAEILPDLLSDESRREWQRVCQRYAHIKASSIYPAPNAH